jgi:hypothetical protein
MENFTQELLVDPNQWLEVVPTTYQAEPGASEFPPISSYRNNLQCVNAFQSHIDPQAVIQISRDVIRQGILWFLTIGLMGLLIGYLSDNFLMDIYGDEKILPLFLSFLIVAGISFMAFKNARLIFISEIKGYTILVGIMATLIICMILPMKMAIAKDDSLLFVFILTILTFFPIKTINIASKMKKIQRGFGKNTHGKLIAFVLIMKVIGQLALLECILLVALYFV